MSSKAPSPVIEVKDLKKYYGSTKAVDGISFSVSKGKIVGFLGPNGAGKTTAIRCMMDFMRPDSGSVSILGKDSVMNSSGIKQDVGYLSSEYTLYENWSGSDHIRFIQSLRSLGDTADELVNIFDLDVSKKVSKLSSGNKQKLSLILALMHRPKVLILDEPTTGLDPLLQNTIYETLREQVAKGTTVFMSSHNLAEVERVCDRVIIIRDGKIVEESELSELSGKRLYTIFAYFKDVFDESQFKIDGVDIVDKFKDGVQLSVKGDVGPIIKKISAMDVKDIEVKHASLEDVFMEFYK